MHVPTQPRLGSGVRPWYTVPDVDSKIELVAEVVKRCQELCRIVNLTWVCPALSTSPEMDMYSSKETSRLRGDGFKHATGQRITEAIADVLADLEGGAT